MKRCIGRAVLALLFAPAPLLLCGAGIVAQAEEGAEEGAEQGGGTRLELRISPLVDLYFEARARAAAPDGQGGAGRTGGAGPAGPDAVAAARVLQESLGSWGGWGPLDSRLLDLADEGPDTLVASFEQIAEPYERRGRTISLRDDAVRFARALHDRFPAFLETEWPARKAALEAKIAALETGFMPRHREALAFMTTSLGIEDPGVAVPIWLVTAVNPPGAMTYFLFGGRQASVIETKVGGADALLRETVLHESCHALDMASESAGSAFTALREMLEARGLTRRDRAWHTIPHTLMFVQAEETIRRLFDPEHVAYGDATDLYASTGETAVVERAIWKRHLDGELTREAALRAIVDRLVPETPTD